MRWIAIGIGLMALLNGTVRAGERDLVAAWRALNEDCRGGSGDDAATIKDWDSRAVVSEQLRAHGCRYHLGDYWTCKRRP